MLRNFIGPAFTLSILFIWSCIGQAGTFEISSDELTWLEAHPEIIVGLGKNNPPQSVLSNKGIPEGIDPEIVKLLNQKLSDRLKIVTGSWQDIFIDAKEKRIDVLLSVTPTEERRIYFNYTRPYISDPHVIVAKKDGQHFGSLNTLSGHTVALEHNTFLVSYLREHYPTIKIKEYTDSFTALKAVQSGETQAYAGGKLMADYLLSSSGIADLDFHGQSTATSETNVIAVRKDWPELTALLDRALATIPHNKLMATINHWDKIKANRRKIATKDITLTDEEVIWIQSHPTILVGAETDWPPYDYVANGKAIGFANEYLQLLAEKAGLNLRFIYGFTWFELLDKAKKKEIDILPCLSKTDVREKFLTFSRPYLENSHSLVVHQNTRGIHSLDDLAGKRLARIRGYSTNKLLIEQYPGIDVVYVDSAIEALVAVSEGRVEGFINYLGSINYLSQEHLIDNLSIANTNIRPLARPYHIGVRKDWPVLKGILEKAMGSVTQNEHNDLRRLWLNTSKITSSEFKLSPAEKTWLSNLGTLRMGVEDWAPIQFMEDKKSYLGISSEYIKIFKDKLGLDLQTRPGHWHEIMEKTRQGDIDLLPLLNETEERREFLTFSKPVMRIPIIIGTRIDAPYYQDIDNLKNITVGVGEGYSTQKKLLRDHPAINTKGYPTIEEAILALNSGKIQAIVANSAVFTYYKIKLGLQGTIHINNTTELEDVLSVGVRHEFAPLVPLLNRVLAGVSSEQHELITDKWLNIHVHKLTDWRMIWQVSGVSVAVLLLVLIWNFKVVREVKRRRKAEANLAESDGRFNSVFSRISDVVVVWDKNYNHIYANQNALDFVNLKREDVYGKNIWDIFPKDFQFADLWRKRIGETFKDGKKRYHVDHTTLNGQEIFSESTMSPLFTDSGNIYAVSLVYKDVTERNKDKAELKKYADTQAVLLREVNHRVKNNLAAIISMLHMERDKPHVHECTELCKRPLKAIEKRISSLLLIHSMLSDTEWQPLPLSDLCEKVIRQSIRGFICNKEFDLDILDCDILLDSDKAHSLALVLNELTVNSAKYAIVDGTKLAITVSIAGGERSIELTYSDNGPGFPEPILKGVKADGGIGMEIIEGISCGNLGGRCEYFNDGGTCTQIMFPVKDEEQDMIEDNNQIISMANITK